MKPIEPGMLILPYTKSLPITTFQQTDPDAPDGLFIRARFHEGLGVWYSDCSDGSTPSHPLSSKGGLIVFVPRKIKLAEVVRVTASISPSAARGTPLLATLDFQTPLDFELSNIGKTV